MHRLVLLLGTLVLILAACGGESRPSPSGDVRVTVDGREVALVPASSLGRRMDLTVIDGVPALAAWRGLEATSGGRVLAVEDVATRYPEQDVALFLDESGRPALGIFRRDRPELTDEVRALIRTPTVALHDARSVDIRTEVAEKPTATAPSLLVVTGEEAPRELDGGRLKTLTPFAGAEHGGGGRKKGNQRRRKGSGYHLADVLALVETRAVASARLITAGGDEVVVERALLDAREGRVPTLKLNRRGQFNYRATGGNQLRDVKRIELTLAP